MNIDAAISTDPISSEQLPEPGVRDGARVVFAGIVRNHDQGRPVARLDYSAHPQAGEFLYRAAQSVLEKLAAEFGEKGQDAEPDQVYLRHRTGSLQIGDVAFLVSVDSAHRGLAFRAASDLVDQVKATVPIWKHQFYTDGTDDWSNCPG